jgi:predicted phage baseplate assembly protein
MLAAAAALRVLLPAADAEPAVEARAVAGSAPDGARTRVALDRPLDEVLAPESITLYGNVVEATHGRTMTREVLGGSDGSPSQAFLLKATRGAPLTWLDTDGTPLPQIDVYVAGRRWTRVDHWGDAGPTDRVYAVEFHDATEAQTAADGTFWVRFGDGSRGALPPAGNENVVATYRYGGGAAGDVDAGLIRQLRQKPPAIRSVSNPLPSTGGADLEPLSSLRGRATLPVRRLDRVVSVGDAEEFARTFPGVADARSRMAWDGTQHLLTITVATTEEATGHRLVAGSSIDVGLGAGLRPLASEHLDLVVGSAEIHPFDVGAALTIDPDRDAELVLAAATAALSAEFAFARRHLAEPVAASDVIRCLSSVAGVVNARVTRLARSGAADDARVPARLVAADAGYDRETKSVRFAEMLVLRAAGLSLAVEPSP